MFNKRAIAVIACLVAIVCYALIAIPAIRTGLHGVSPLFQDDAFYYIVTAKHFVDKSVFTFDGVNETNGFHPLWMAIVVALFKACGSGCTPEQQIFTVKLTETLLRGVAVTLCVAFFAGATRRERAIGTGYLGVAIVLLCPAFVIFDQGMETTLAVLLFILVMHAWMEGSAALGLWLALLFLARLDTLVFVAAPVLIAQFRFDRRKPAQWIATALPVAIVFAMYSGYNLARTGHAVPISGAIRSSFPAITWHGSYLIEPLTIASMYGWRTLISANTILVAVALIAAFLLLLTSRPMREQERRLLTIGIVGAMLFCNLLFFQQWDKSLDPRYLALPLAASAFFLGAAFELVCVRIAQDRWTAVRALPAMCVLVLLIAETIAFAQKFESDYEQMNDPAMALFRSVGEAVPAKSVIAGTDVGALAFWSGRRVVNLDGVINNYAYQQYVRDGRLKTYLREQGVDHIATALIDQAPAYTGRPVEPMYRQAVDAAATHGTDYTAHDYYVYSYVYHAYSDTIRLTPSQEVFRRVVANSGGAQITYVVYRIAP